MRPIVAFQGESGAFSESAAQRLVSGAITLLPMQTFDAVVRAVVDGHADLAVIPVENVIAGPVHAALDAMAPFASLERIGETQLPIHLTLMGLAGARVESLREVLSHPMALKQCTRFFATHPAIHAVEAPDTAGSARMVAVRRDETVAAIAPPWAAQQYGLSVIQEHLEDRDDNVTTFVLIRRKASTSPPQG